MSKKITLKYKQPTRVYSFIWTKLWEIFLKLTFPKCSTHFYHYYWNKVERNFQGPLTNQSAQHRVFTTDYSSCWSAVRIINIKKNSTATSCARKADFRFWLLLTTLTETICVVFLPSKRSDGQLLLLAQFKHLLILQNRQSFKNHLTDCSPILISSSSLYQT